MSASASAAEGDSAVQISGLQRKLNNLLGQRTVIHKRFHNQLRLRRKFDSSLIGYEKFRRRAETKGDADEVERLGDNIARCEAAISDHQSKMDDADEKMTELDGEIGQLRVELADLMVPEPEESLETSKEGEDVDPLSMNSAGLGKEERTKKVVRVPGYGSEDRYTLEPLLEEGSGSGSDLDLVRSFEGEKGSKSLSF